MARHIIKIYGRNSFSTCVFCLPRPVLAVHFGQCGEGFNATRTKLQLIDSTASMIMCPRKSLVNRLRKVASGSTHNATAHFRCLEITCFEAIICNWLSANYIYCLLALLAKRRRRRVHHVRSSQRWYGSSQLVGRVSKVRTGNLRFVIDRKSSSDVLRCFWGTHIIWHKRYQ